MKEDFEITRAAVEIQRKPPKTAEDLEIERATSLSNAFNFLNKMWIGVSFVHMAMIMLLFTAHGTGVVWFFTTAAALVMVLGIDLALMRLSVYITIQREYHQPVGFWAWIVFLVSLGVEWTFNTGALWANMPGPEKLPPALSKTIAVTFGTFVALIIYVSATIPTRLARTALVIREQAEQRRRDEAERQRNRDEHRRKQEEAAERRRQREESANAPTVTTVDFVPSQSHNEPKSLPETPTTATLRTGNGKAEIGTGDIAAIIRALYDGRVKAFRTADELCALCGWSARSSGTKAIANLKAAGVVTANSGGGGYAVNWKTAQPIMLAAEAKTAN